MTKQQSKWNADAEMSLMGFTIPVENEEHLKHLIGYVLKVITKDGGSAQVEEVFNSCHQYNSDKVPVSHFTVNSTQFGVLMTFVRDCKDMTEDKLISPQGVLSYVYNMDAPYCSELGYTFFQKVNGKIKRVA